MAKKNDYQPSQAEVDLLIAMPKKVIFSGVNWKASTDGRTPVWLKMDMQAFDMNGLPLNGVLILLHWRKPLSKDVDVAKLSFIIFLHNRRIFAIDPHPNEKPHRNRNALNHVDFVAVTRGPHYHQYFESVGEDVAFNLCTDIAPDDLQAYWNYFCERLNIKYTGSIPLPNQEESGQLSWEM